ncbi:MAG: class I SAM-dependent methyltransferase [Planctomycetota bacterium]
MTAVSECAAHCIACGSGALKTVPSAALRCGITSDVKPWPRCGIFAHCSACGHLQKIQDAQWRADVERIYSEYEMYVLSGGNEQVVFEGGQPAPRTRRLLEKVLREVSLPEDGWMLDVGCGNGSLLRTVNSLRPRWQLAGFDVHDRFRAAVENVPGVREFYSGSVEQVGRAFDLISLTYVIEHLFEPLAVVRQLRQKLKPGGKLLIHTSNYLENPFDLAVVDHCSHFSPRTLAALVECAGFEVVAHGDDWIPKEIGVVARGAGCPACEPAGATSAPHRLTACATGNESYASAAGRLAWLAQVLEQARAGLASGAFYIFGTAIAGSWLASMLGPGVCGFVDEDPQRLGKQHLGLPVINPAGVPAGATVYLAFAPHLARKLQQRLQGQYPAVAYVVTPGWEEEA